MPTDVHVGASLLCGRLDVALQEVVRPVGLRAFHGWTGEEPITVERVGTVFSPTQKILMHLIAGVCTAAEPRELSQERGRVRFAGLHHLLSTKASPLEVE